MLSQRLVINSIFLLILISFKGLCDDLYKKPANIILSYIPHPQVQAYVDLIKSVYEDDLGIKVTLHSTPAHRGLIMLNSGVTDADVIRIGTNAATFDNLVVIEPQLEIGELLLVCRLDVTCSLDVLADPNIVVMSNIGNEMTLKELNIKANVLLHENIETVLEFMHKRQIVYGIYASTKDIRQTVQKDFNAIKLKDVGLNHVIHKKHSALIPELTSSIKKRLKDL
ncbi:MAG: hypothetical protein CL811_12040 [Colwelliaceae bacterium]|nr:hypothetical protein [Colwelliaceae bacterium]